MLLIPPSRDQTASLHLIHFHFPKIVKWFSRRSRGFLLSHFCPHRLVSLFATWFVLLPGLSGLVLLLLLFFFFMMKACFSPAADASCGGAGVPVIALRPPPVLSVEIAQLPTLSPPSRRLHGIQCDLTGASGRAAVLHAGKSEISWGKKKPTTTSVCRASRRVTRASCRVCTEQPSNSLHCAVAAGEHAHQNPGCT